METTVGTNEWRNRVSGTLSRHPVPFGLSVGLLIFALAVGLASVPGCGGLAPPGAVESREGAPASLGILEAEFPADTAVPRQLVRSVELVVTVDDTVAVAAEIESLTERMGGYVSSSSSDRRLGRTFHDMVVRVPSARLSEAVAAIKGMAAEVLFEELKTQDVTDRLVDLDARLGTLRATETELRVLLSRSQSREQNVEGIMAIYRELMQIRTEIERLEAQRKNLAQRVELSLINVRLRPSSAAQPLVTDEWRPLYTFRGSVRVLLRVLRFLGDAAIAVVVVVIPIVALLALPVFYIRRRLRRSRGEVAHSSTTAAGLGGEAEENRR